MSLGKIVKDVVSVPAVVVSMDTITHIENNQDQSYEVRLLSGTGIGISKERKEFRDGLKEGDNVIVVRESSTVKMFYGPIDEKKLYTN